MSVVLYRILFLIALYQFLFQNVISLKHNNFTSFMQKRNGGFLFSMPKTLVTGRNETVCLSLHQTHLPTEILIDLKWKEHYTTLRHVDSEHTCFHLFVPLKNILDPQFVSIRVQVRGIDEVHSAHNHDPVLVYPNKLTKMLIETDRRIYKPGDTVKFRILFLNENFLPTATKVSEIKIKNPMGITVELWSNIETDHGLISLEYQMVAEAMTGKWKIELENQTKNFDVSKYMVPRFKIELKYPKLLYYKNNAMMVSVCAKYSYSKPVAGMAFIKVSDSHNVLRPVNKLLEMSNGCSYFEINEDELNLVKVYEKKPTYDPNMNIFITATVTEHGTNKMDVATGKSQVLLKAYNLKFRNNSIFIPGMSYIGQLKLTNNVTSIIGEVIEICYNIAIKKSWNYFNNEQCQNFTIHDEGVIPFKLRPFKNSVLHVHLHARSLNNSMIEDKLLVVRLYSPSSSYIYLEKENDSNNPTCDTAHQYKVVYTTDDLQEGDNITFYYLIKTNTEIYKLRKLIHSVSKNIPNYSAHEDSYLGEKHKFVKLGTNVDEFYIKFKLDRKFVSRVHLLVYYVRNDGETVAVTRSDETEPCTLKVESFWKQAKLVPGEIATLTIKSESPALCAVSVMDKASRFIFNNNQNLNFERVLKVVSQDREGASSGRNGCISHPKRNHAETASKLIWDSRRQKRHIYSFAEDYDSYDIFSRFGVITITNLQVVTKHCYSGPLLNDTHQVQFLVDQYSSDNEDNSQNTIRSFFPENWLWELVPANNSVQLQRELPHSITNWVSNVFCISETEGIGFSPETELLSFQTFFVQVLAPYSLKKGEYSNFQIYVVNYMNYTFPIRISIRLSSNLAGSNILSATYCLAENNTVTHVYSVTGLEVGTANVTVLVETENQFPLPCGPETIISKRDVVYKSIKIEPEGHLVTKTKTALLCGSNKALENNVTWEIIIPDDIVVGTANVAVTINTDILGRTIENLHQLITMPTGCGEQITASMAPNVYILHYLNATGRLTPSIKQRIIRTLKMGYQRILNYVHMDGSFSAFGYYDQSGSMFLTAFVVKILQAAKNFIYVDQRVIEKAVNWIFNHQLENGCFDTMDHVFQDMGGTNIENSTAGLTAYVILSLFSSKVNVPDTIQTNAKYCIRSQHNADKYSLIISCYALFKVHWISEANRFLEKVIAVSNKENDMMWWNTKGDDEYYASDIEITSYALLALLHQKTAENMAYAHSVVQWLTSKIGPTGGYKSTQDTVVALDALTTYAEYIHTDKLDIKIHLETYQEKHMLAIRENDRFKSKQVNLQNKNSEVKLYLTGIGCALTQLAISYFSTNISKSEAFKLAVDVASVSNVDECSIKTISPCVAYQGPEKLSNMAVMEISLPSGYEADRTSLHDLLENGSHKKIKMFEEKENQINFYFTKLDQYQVCFSFNINENTALENRKESLVKLYDYYRPEQHILQFYKIMNNCSNISIDDSENSVHASNSHLNSTQEKTHALDSSPKPKIEITIPTEKTLNYSETIDYTEL